MNLTRLSVNMNDATRDALVELAKRHSDSYTETVRRAISLYKFFQDEVDAGGKVYIKTPDGYARKVRMRR